MSKADTAPKRARRVTTTDRVVTPRVETKDYSAFAHRIVKAFSKRVAAGDIEALTDLLAFATYIDEALQDAVDGLREEPYCYTWPEIAARAGMKPIDAYTRWAATQSALPAEIEELLATQEALFTVGEQR